MTRLLTSSWFVALTSCVVYLATTVILLRPSQFAMAQAVHQASRSPNDDPSWRFRNPEFEQWVEEIKSEKEALRLREQQLRELQTRLDAERQEILTLTQAVHHLQTQFDKGVVRFKEQEIDNLKLQTKIIAGMSPEGAAAILNEMPEDEIVRVLFSLKADQSGQILESMSKTGKTEAKHAADLALRLRKVVSPPPTGSTKSPPN
jgi:flagellar motility protein MotE (MotC chaperone)